MGKSEAKNMTRKSYENPRTARSTYGDLSIDNPNLSPGALNIYPNELSDSGRAGLAGAHAGHRIKRGNPDLAVADSAGAGGLDDHTD